MEEDEERLHDWVRGGGEFVAGGEDAAGSGGFGVWWWCRCGWGFGGGDLLGDSFGDFFGDSLDGGYEAVASAGEGLDEAGAGGGVAEGFADAVDGGVDAVFVVDEGAVGPELAGDLFAGEEGCRGGRGAGRGPGRAGR